MPKKSLSLRELNSQIKQGVEGLFPFPVWIVAEISELSVKNHCYLELIERDEKSDSIIAKSRAMIWSYTYNILKAYFETSTGYEFNSGLKVMVQVEVQYNELYGMSLSIKDVDPNYTLGDVQKRRQLILQKLEDEGILEMNKSIEFPIIPKTIAIISSDKAAGYQDFIKQLENNGMNFKFHTHLFPALMQGNQSTASIMHALEEIYEYDEVFDAVVIIRGGGAVSDLSSFDDYELAAHVAQFPLPVLTGIGHDKDLSIVDEVAYSSFKTPTAVASFLIHCFETCNSEINEKRLQISQLVKEQIMSEKQALSTYSNSLKYTLPSLISSTRQELKIAVSNFNFLVLEQLTLAKNNQAKMKQSLYYTVSQANHKRRNKILDVEQKLHYRTRKFIHREKELLQHKLQINELLSPQKMLERGYSITTVDGRVLKNELEVNKGAEIITQLAEGVIKSRVE